MLKYYENPALCPSIQFCSRVNGEESLDRTMAKAHRFRRLKRLTLFGEGNDELLPQKFGEDLKPLHIGSFALLKASERHVEELVINGWIEENLREASWQSLHSSDLTVLPSLKRLTFVSFSLIFIILLFTRLQPPRFPG